MPTGKFTNAPSSRTSSIEVPKANVRNRPYVTSQYASKVMPMTDKEKQARSMTRGKTANFAIDPVGNANTVMSGTSSFFSVQLSTDFLQLPQSIREKREIYRHFYNTSEIVAQSIDLHTELPLSKVRLTAPKPRTCPEGFDSPEDYGKYILTFFERMTKKIKLFQKLVLIVKHLYLDGSCLPPDELVSIESGIKRADEVQIGDLVLTHKGRWRPVTAVIELDCPSLIHIDVARLPGELRVTPEHPVEVLRDGMPVFLPAGDIRKNDYVRVTFPTEIQDTEKVDLLQDVPGYVTRTPNGYSVDRVQIRNRSSSALRVRSYLIAWLSTLKEPTFRLAEDVAKAAGGSVYTLNNVMQHLEKECSFEFKRRVASGPRKGSHTMWLPSPQLKQFDSDTYCIDRKWEFSQAVTSLKVDDDLLYVIGYWLGDGTLSRDSSRDTEWGRGGWSICGGNTSLEYLGKVEECLRRMFGSDFVTRSVEDSDESRETLHVLRVTGNPAFVEWWAKNFGETSHGENKKRVPSWVLALPHDKQLSLLGGIIDSDGCVPRTHVGGIRVSVTSINVASAVRDIMLRLGAVPSMNFSDSQVGKVSTSGKRYNFPSYLVTLSSEAESRYLLTKSCKAPRLNEAPRFFKSNNTYIVREDGIYFKVNSVSTSKSANPTVYNFQVEEDSTFRARFVSTHNCPIFAEDSDVEIPPDIGYNEQVTPKSVLTDDGDTVEEHEKSYIEKDNREDEELLYYQKHYKGWDRLIVFPIDQVDIKTYSFSDKVRIDLIPSERDRELLEQAKAGDPVAIEMAEEMPAEVREYMGQGRLIPLGTDPDEGSFVHLLSNRKLAGDELGQSILDRCHLAGTPVLAKRNGIICQVPIEDLDPDTDFVLSSKGNWCEFEVGIRKVASEKMALIHTAKVYPPIGSTADHKYPVLRDGKVVETTAGNIVPGDYLQVAQVPLTESFPNKVDLSKFMDGITDTYKTRRSKGTSDLHLEVVDATQETFTVTYRKNQTDPRVIGRTGDINTILEWASTLSEPVMMRSAEVCERFQLHPSTLKEIRYQLVNLGYGVTVTKGKSIVFPPNTCGLRASTQADHTKSFSRWLDLNSDLGYLLGYWLGDGHIAKQDGLDYGIFGIVYSNNVPTSARSGSELKSIISKLGFPCSETFTDLNNMTLLSVYHDAMVRWVASNFGHVCEDKHLPDWIYDAPKDFLLGILRGFVDSDGSVFQKKDGSISVGLNNTNALLMEQLFLVCTSFGIPVSKTKPTSSEWVKFPDGSLCWSKALHIIHFTHAPSVKSFFESGHLSKRKDPTMWKDGRSGTRHVVHGGKLYYRVNKVDNSEHTGAVYSLNVHDDHTFFAGNTGTCNCLRTLYYMDKLRQAQSQIADRAMTPKRIVWAEDISDADADELREQVDLSLVDPDYSIVANYEIHWEEMGSKDRLLDLTAEYEQGERRLRTGLGVTESLLSGETLYSGDRLKLEVINTRYLLLREELQEYVQEYLFAPVARRKGFVEKDKWGDEVVLHPNLSFTRLPLRDSQDTYDALFNLYAKGSISIDLILEMFNIDPDDTARKIKNDTFTVNDAIFNEMTRALYGAVGSALAEKTDVMDKMAQYLGLKMKEESAPQDPGRFG